jgi:hypothetical protein
MHGNKKVCIYFQKGNCIKGSSCNFSHELDSGFQNKMQSNYQSDRNSMQTGLQGAMNITPTDQQFQNKPQSKICEFFMKGTCTKQSCRFFHGYSENLQNVKIEKIHEKNLIGTCQISDTKFITADQNLIQIWLITESEHKILGSQTFDEKITKVLYSNEKVIVSTQIEQMYARFLLVLEIELYSTQY